ncbi:MAG: magnesium-translocating P-type ATPase [Candidatus Uhrbacteria bacterium]|nr:magnesium-translocating P-type ATPase [Candidatus Uhrbacteria bacterium]
MSQLSEKYATCSTEQLFSDLKTSKEGLVDIEVFHRFQTDGPNSISDKKEIGIVLEFLSHFKSPLILILISATAISLYFGQVTNSMIVTIMILASVCLDFFEEHSAGNAAKRLKDKVSATATVIRSGEKKEIKIVEVCVGDILFLSSGDLIPADAIVFEADDFFVNQSALTGESFPKEKYPCGFGTDEASHVLFLGSSVVSGTARAVVFAIGKQTEFGKIAETLLKKQDKSDFELGIDHFGFFISKIILFLVMTIFLVQALMHRDILESFMFAVAIAVGVTPELLPVIMSVTMARGSERMAKDGVIVKRLSAMPNFGSMDILCTDKTGTLTEDKIQLVTFTDGFGAKDDRVLLYTYLNSFHQTGVKNPLDKAVIDFDGQDISAYKKVEEIPFDFVRKLMSVAVEGPEGRTLITKGAPEEVLAKCTMYHQGDRVGVLGKELYAKAIAYYESLSADGFRVLAVAIRSHVEVKEQYAKEDESDLTFMGFVSFLDPAKKDVKGVLVELEQYGIEVKIITGDNELVTKKVCTDIGLPMKGILLGKEISTMTDDALRVRAEETTIFARFSPDEKNRVIIALRSGGHVVGYMGDGINDAPSLKTADVGISVNTAVDVAKESADIILTQKGLESIVRGVIEGRRSFGNTMKYIMMGLSSNFGNMFSVLGAVFYLPFLPMLPIQILFNNFVYDVSQLTISSDNVDEDWIRTPRKWDLKRLKKFMYTFGLISSLFDFATFILLFSIFHVSESVFQTGWFMESLATQTLVIHIIRTRKIPFLQSRPSKWLFLSTFACLAVGWIIPYTPIGTLLHFSPLPFPIVLLIIGLVLVYLLIVEIGKRLFYRKHGF